MTVLSANFVSWKRNEWRKTFSRIKQWISAKFESCFASFFLFERENEQKLLKSVDNGNLETGQ